MRLLVATDTGHSPRTDPDNDLPLPGEMLMPAEQCDKPHCFCRREFVSVVSLSRTTHAHIIDLDISHEQLLDIARDYVRQVYPDIDIVDLDEEAAAYVDDLTLPDDIDFPAGTVVERWGHELRDIRDNNLGDDE